MVKQSESRFAVALRDLLAAIHLLPATFFLTWSDTRARYRRSILGPFWLVLSTAIGVVGLGFLWSALLHSPREQFIPALTVGLVVWQLITGCVTESSGVFVRSAQVVRNLKIPFFFHPLQTLMRQIINFSHNLVVIVAVFLIYPPLLNGAQWLAIPGMILLLGNLLWITMLVGLLGARYRDIEYLINSIMPLLFFLSPVIYRPDHLGIKQEIVWLNPFTYFISVVRDPLQGMVPNAMVYGVTIGILILGWIAVLSMFGAKYKRIAFWV